MGRLWNPVGVQDRGVFATQGAPSATLGFAVQRRWRKGCRRIPLIGLRTWWCSARSVHFSDPG